MGVLLLFGGGLSLSNAITKSELDKQIGIAAAGLEGIPIWLLLTAVVLLVVAISEMASNVATATTMIPVLMGAAGAMGIDPIVLLSATVLASSCGFMMPVATPPNTLVFSQKKIPGKRHANRRFWCESPCDHGDSSSRHVDPSKGAKQVISGYTFRC